VSKKFMPYLDLNHERIYYALYRGELIPSRSIILIHGAGENHLVWPAGLRRLPYSTVYAIDLPGHGKSTGNGRDSINEYVTWLKIFLDTLKIQRAIIIGHSMGTAIAQMFALAQPDRTAGLVLIGAGAKLRVAPKILELARNDLAAAAELITSLEWGPDVPEQIVRLGKQQLMTNRSEVIYGDYRACNEFDVIDRLGDITAPTLIISGTADQLTPPKYAAFMAEKIPHAKLVSVPDAGHMTMLEAESIVAREVEKFLQGLV
jgi:pimeloyl-ACP methyl ester carboxylesterase